MRKQALVGHDEDRDVAVGQQVDGVIERSAVEAWQHLPHLDAAGEDAIGAVDNHGDDQQTERAAHVAGRGQQQGHDSDQTAEAGIKVDCPSCCFSHDGFAPRNESARGVAGAWWVFLP